VPNTHEVLAALTKTPACDTRHRRARGSASLRSRGSRRATGSRSAGGGGSGESDPSDSDEPPPTGRGLPDAIRVVPGVSR
jgi:hypothetical protein